MFFKLIWVIIKINLSLPLSKTRSGLCLCFEISRVGGLMKIAGARLSGSARNIVDQWTSGRVQWWNKYCLFLCVFLLNLEFYKKNFWKLWNANVTVWTIASVLSRGWGCRKIQNCNPGVFTSACENWVDFWELARLPEKFYLALASPCFKEKTKKPT